MSLISPLLSGFSQMTVAVCNSTPHLIILTTGVLKDFFLNLFMNPGSNYTAVMIIAGSVVAAGVGLAFLVKWVYDKYCPDHIISIPD